MLFLSGSAFIVIISMNVLHNASYTTSIMYKSREQYTQNWTLYSKVVFDNISQLIVVVSFFSIYNYVNIFYTNTIVFVSSLRFNKYSLEMHRYICQKQFFT